MKRFTRKPMIGRHGARRFAIFLCTIGLCACTIQAQSADTQGDEAHRTCIGCGSDAEYDDGNPCTAQTCENGQCQAIAIADCCTADADCTTGFCRWPDGQCGPSGAAAAGNCHVPAGGCPKLLAPVCGCDDVTYPNDCEMLVQHVSLKHGGACTDGCAACGPEEACYHETCVAPGESGWPCLENSDCLSGYCAADGTGVTVCTQRCLEACPLGWSCRLLPNGPDRVFVCLPDCVPDCEGKECGDDGCDGSCGQCPTTLECTPKGLCVAPVNDICLDLDSTGGENGLGVSDYHLCDGNMSVFDPFYGPRTCTDTLGTWATETLHAAALDVDWSAVQPTYSSPENPDCCCDQLVWDLHIEFDTLGEPIVLDTHWCSESFDWMPADFVHFLDVLQQAGSTVTNPDTCVEAGPCDGVDCDDGNACTVDRCDPYFGGCFSALMPDGAACDDGDACTTNDVCLAGLCIGVAGGCGNGNPGT